MGELQVEDAEEERFQADLKMAVRQSLGIIFSFHACLVISLSSCKICLTVNDLEK